MIPRSVETLVPLEPPGVTTSQVVTDLDASREALAALIRAPEQALSLGGAKL
jgi:hypothetical protein